MKHPPTTGPRRLALATAALVLLPALASAQVLTDVSPPNGTLGTIVTIRGSGFGTDRARVWLQAAGATRKAPLRVLSVAPDRIEAAIVRADPGPGELHVRLPGAGRGDSIAFEVLAPAISGFSPGTAAPGDLVTVSGSHFGQRRGKLLLYTTPCKVIAWADDAVTFRVPRSVPDGEWTPCVQNRVGSDWGDSALVVGGSLAPAPLEGAELRAGDIVMVAEPADVMATQVGTRIGIDAFAYGTKTQQLSILVPFLAKSSKVPTTLSGTGYGTEPCFYVEVDASTTPATKRKYSIKPTQQPWSLSILARSHGVLLGTLSGVLVQQGVSPPATVEIERGTFAAQF